MNRILKWVYLVTFAFIGFLLVQSMVMYPGEPTLSFRDSPDLVAAVLMIATSGVCVLMVARLFPIYLKKRKDPLLVEILISIFLFLGLTILVEGIFSIIRITPRQLNLVCIQSTFFYLAAAGLLLAYFQTEVFGGGIREGRNRMWLTIVACIAIMLDVGIMIDTISGLVPWQLALIGAPGVFVLYLLFAKLAFSALRTVKKIEDPVVKQSYHLMGQGWLVLFFGFIFLIVGGFFDIQEVLDPINPFIYPTLSVITFAVVFIGTALLYIGFTLPMKTIPR